MEGFLGPLLIALAAGAAVIATGQFIVRPKGPKNHLLAVGSYCLSYILLYFNLLETGGIRSVPLLMYSDIWMTFIIAPAIYLSFRLTIWKEARKIGSCWPYLIPAVLAFAAGMGYNALASPLAGDWRTAPSHFATPFVHFFSLGSDLYFSGFMLAANLEARASARGGDGPNRLRLRPLRAFLAALLAGGLGNVAANILRIELVFVASCTLIGLSVIAYALYCTSATGDIRSLWFGEQRKKPRAGASQDDERLGRRLDELMETRKLYKQTELSLAKLAARMGVSSARLSRIVNDRTGMSFRRYLNSLRIAAVREELLRQPGRSILDIALENGFNSKTAFNTEFQKICGQSPREFRRSKGPDRAAAEKPRFADYPSSPGRLPPSSTSTPE